MQVTRSRQQDLPSGLFSPEMEPNDKGSSEVFDGGQNEVAGPVTAAISTTNNIIDSTVERHSTAKRTLDQNNTWRNGGGICVFKGHRIGLTMKQPTHNSAIITEDCIFHVHSSVSESQAYSSLSLPHRVPSELIHRIASYGSLSTWWIVDNIEVRQMKLVVVMGWVFYGFHGIGNHEYRGKITSKQL